MSATAPGPAVVDRAAGLAARVLAGDVRATARVLSMVEDGHPGVREILAALSARAGRAWVIGLTGSPGVGKSTSTSALVSVLRAADITVAVLAVDPSSPFSGGALLGDRVRMQEHATDAGVYIRSMASRGHLGGLAAATPQAVRVLDAAGWDVVLIETVGVGQSEIEVMSVADAVVVLLAPGMGDGIQAAKAGILEIGDLFVVNKADRDGAQTTAREIRAMVAMAVRDDADWKPPVLKTVAASGTGVPEVYAALQEHRAWAQAGGAWHGRRRRRAAQEIQTLVLAHLRHQLTTAPGVGFDDLVEQVRSGTMDPFTAADIALAAMPH